MKSRLPPDAFDVYVSLGPERSYQAVAEHFGVSKRAVTRLATQEDWQDRLNAIEREARERTDSRLVETVETMNRRHLKILQAIQARALETLRSMPLTTAMEAVRSLDLTIRQERVIRGEPGDRTAFSMEDVIRREYERWMTTADDETTRSTSVPEATDDDDIAAD